MTKRPRKTKSAAKARPAEPQSRGMAELRNRLIGATAIMALAALLVWKPWSHESTTANKAVASVTTAAQVASAAHPQKPAALATPLGGEAAIAPTPSYTTAAVTQVVPLSSTPPTPPINPRMPATLEADFDAWLIDAYRACWTPPGGVPDGDPYYPRVRVALKSDGTLAGPPKLVNPPWDAAWKGHAEAAIKAVKACDPLKVPDKYAPYYTQWKSKTVFFAPTRS